MKLKVLSLFLSLLIFSACGEKTNSGKQSPSAPLNKYCLVEPQHEIDPEVTLVYEGRTYAFCCKDCIATFKEDPRKYIALFESREKKSI